MGRCLSKKKVLSKSAEPGTVLPSSLPPTPKLSMAPHCSLSLAFRDSSALKVLQLDLHPFDIAFLVCFSVLFGESTSYRRAAAKYRGLCDNVLFSLKGRVGFKESKQHVDRSGASPSHLQDTEQQEAKLRFLLKESFFFTGIAYYLIPCDAFIQLQECAMARGKATLHASWICLQDTYLPKPTSPSLQATSPNSHHTHNVTPNLGDHKGWSPLICLFSPNGP